MYSFILSVLALICGYIFYSSFVSKVFGPDGRRTPAIKKADGVDFVPMPAWRVFMIQFLNIAGTGPIFGAIMGAKFGPASYLWIVFGCIFAGAVHDYLSGMLSMRHGGAGLPQIIGIYLGNRSRRLMLIFSLILLILVGAVFTYSPAIILGDIAGDGSQKAMLTWAAVIFLYYIVATILPIDKIIGKIYPLFAIALLFMAVSLMVCILIKWPSIPEIWDGLGNRGPSLGMKGQPIFPCLFITIACGAISGFHATQSPMMARCMKTEFLGRPVFYGAMITEGIVALIWAAVSSYFFFDGGAAEVGSSLSASAPAVVTSVAKSWLGTLGGILTVFGVVAAPITSGDTAMRSARLIVADAFKIDQKRIMPRLLVSIPLFILSALMLWFNISDQDGFNTIWKYFGWANQSISIFTLWALTVFLAARKKGRRYLITMIPAAFMTAVCVTFILVDKIGFGLPASTAPWIGIGVFLVASLCLDTWRLNRTRRKNKIVNKATTNR
ncbi:MAG: carbon starvation protein A [Bacteroidales bacterium]|nr:carbon starvation protein A [Bacteroidales bacterium]